MIWRWKGMEMSQLFWVLTFFQLVTIFEVYSKYQDFCCFLGNMSIVLLWNMSFVLPNNKNIRVLLEMCKLYFSYFFHRTQPPSTCTVFFRWNMRFVLPGLTIWYCFCVPLWYCFYGKHCTAFCTSVVIHQ